MVGQNLNLGKLLKAGEEYGSTFNIVKTLVAICKL